ncbi:transporter substrate-binding domain-containing protein, partial [Phocaeicola faecicola]|uniref:transporter substrate-binding domain-containing protein n=1 Tax=Phocaeicola faecicola TaxID=2739389 RepID=UPI002A7EA86B
MRKTHKAIKYMLLAVAIAVGIVWTGSHREKAPLSGEPRSYEEIKASGVLRAVTEYNAISYHVAGDTVQGFDYELLHEFAEAQGLRLEITPEMSYEERLKGILQGQYDVLATGTLVTTRSKDSLLFTHTLALGKQVLVQRKPKDENDSTYIKNPLELAHKTLYITENSPALLRIHNLMNEIADTIYIKEIKDYGPEQLMAMVAGGDIPYTVCDESIAQAS